MSRVRGLIAEDEAPQRQALIDALRDSWPDLDLVAACEDGVAALEAVAQHRPDVAFLDIRMPGVNGLDVARAVTAAGGRVVFTTAYDEYAISAFDAGAVDYLLKPIQPARLAQTIERLRERLRDATPPGLQTLLDRLEASLKPSGERLIRWISASIGDSIRMIGIDEVLYFQAQDKYVRVVTGDGEAVIRTPIKELLAGLDPEVFWQLHRGVIARVGAIDRIQKDDLGKSVARLRGRTELLPVSTAFLHRFRGM